MLSIDQIKTFYPENLHQFPDFILKEYLQYKILEIIYNGSFANNLCFLGGTCLRIVHENRRFSEDLDFDNRSLKEDQFELLAKEIEREMNLLGCKTEVKMVIKSAWHCYIKFPGLLYKEGLSGYKEQKILIQLHTEPQDFDYEPERHILNRFDVFTTILTIPTELLMAQKLFALLNRKRSKGRDFYDVIFLMGKQIQPDYKYLETKLGISDSENLKETMLKKIQTLDLDKISEDVEPFLFKPSEMKRIGMFKELVEQYSF